MHISYEFLIVLSCERGQRSRARSVSTHTLTSALITNANAKFMFAQNEIMLNAFLTLCSPQKLQRERQKNIDREREREAKISWETDP